MALNVIHVRPHGYIHAEGLAELAETVRYGGKDLEGTVVIGAHLGGEFPPDAIIYNTEVVRHGGWFSQDYLAQLCQHRVWDYSEENVRRLAGLGILALHVPVGYVPELTRIVRTVEDIDVLFVGSLNERRIRVLHELEARGVNVVHLFGVYGAERDAYIARAKICLNMHFYVPGVFEIVRCSYYFANHKAVVSEGFPDNDDSLDLYCGRTYEELVPCCIELLGMSEGYRDAIGQVGFNWFRRRDEAKILREALAHA